MDGSNRGLGCFCIRHARIQLRPLRSAEKRDRLGLSEVEPQGCCVCELRKRHGCAGRPAASRDHNRDPNGTHSVIGPHPVATLWAHFQGGDVDKGLAELDKQANIMIDDLTWWTGALKAAREL